MFVFWNPCARAKLHQQKHARKLCSATLKVAKYEIQKPSTCCATLFRCKFSSMFPVFHLVWSTRHATKTFVAGWKKLLQKVERGSTLSNKCWFCCSFFIKLTFCRATNLLMPEPINQSGCCISSTRNKIVFVAGQVNRARWKTGNIDQNLQQNNVARQVEGFCIPYFAVFTGAGVDIDAINYANYANFCRLSSALCTVEWRYLYLQWIVRDTFLFLYDLLKGIMKRIEKQR